ncbi:MAG TPA: hypothetical protein VNB06_01795 [Thermoanaerobaculia bacterium]|nr:hypothetical protein [Thermoanaerobaculia bacterium]
MEARSAVASWLCAVGWLALALEPVAARYEIYHHYIGDEPWPLVAVDGVVAVQHSVGDSQRARNRVLQALPAVVHRSRSPFQRWVDSQFCCWQRCWCS